MHTIQIPIRKLMAEPEQPIEFMSMPHEMDTFAMPQLPEPGPGRDVAGARKVLQVFMQRFDAWLAGQGELAALDLARLAPDALRVLNETLGEGEVSAIVDIGEEVCIQETVFSGIWRQQHFSATDVLLHDDLLAAPVPPLLMAVAQAGASATLRALPLPPGAMNVQPLVHELQQAMDACSADTPSHVINLTLLPLSPQDSAHLDALLEGGTVVVLSRGFGNCRISSTAARNVWRVQYFNNMQTLILNTIEVVAMPEVAIAAREDLVDTRERVADLVQWMNDGATAA